MQIWRSVRRVKYAAGCKRLRRQVRPNRLCGDYSGLRNSRPRAKFRRRRYHPLIYTQGSHTDFPEMVSHDNSTRSHGDAFLRSFAREKSDLYQSHNKWSLNNGMLKPLNKHQDAGQDITNVVRPAEIFHRRSKQPQRGEWENVWKDQYVYHVWGERYFASKGRRRRAGKGENTRTYRTPFVVRHVASCRRCKRGERGVWGIVGVGKLKAEAPRRRSGQPTLRCWGKKKEKVKKRKRKREIAETTPSVAERVLRRALRSREFANVRRWRSCAPRDLIRQSKDWTKRPV